MTKASGKKSIRFLSVLILVTCLAIGAGRAAYAAEGEDVKLDPPVIMVNVSCVQFGDLVSWDFPYSDDFLMQPDDVYSHDLARLSIGAVQATSRKATPGGGADEELPLKFFSEIGFSDIDFTSYRKKPGGNTIMYVLARKKICDDTVIAVAISGFNYDTEWEGNFNVGDEARHVGFQLAAEQVEQGIRNYMEKHGISENVVLWISGISRAAATANLTGADMTSSGSFRRVYVYGFATPPCTRVVEQEYFNIFNILGKNDPVTKTPPPDWGYRRYGVDLYLPSIETDSDYARKEAAMSAVHEQFRGYPYRGNAILNAHLRLLFSYVSELVPDAAAYVQMLQDSICTIMHESDKDQQIYEVLMILQKLAEESSAGPEEQDALIEYIEMLINIYYFQGNREAKEAGYWIEEESLTENVFREHCPITYASWLFSTDEPAELYYGINEYLRVSIRTKSAVEVDQNGNLIQTVSPKGKVTVEEGWAPVFVQKQGGQLVFTIPRDAAYLLQMYPEEDEEMDILVTRCSCDSIRLQPLKHYTIDAKADGHYYVFLSHILEDSSLFVNDSDGIRVDELDNDLNASASMITRLENVNYFGLNLEMIILLMFLLAAFMVLMLLICLVLAVIRRVRKKKSTVAGTIIVHLVCAVVFGVLDLGFFEFMPELPYVHLGFRLICFIFLAVLALKGVKRRQGSVNSILAWSCCGIMILDLGVQVFFHITGGSLAQTVSFIIAVLCMILAPLAWIKTEKTIPMEALE